MIYKYVAIIASTLLLTVFADTTTTPSPQPAYQPKHDPSGSNGYIPHATYPYSDSYGTGSSYQGYLVPAATYNAAGVHVKGNNDFLIQSPQNYWQVALKIFSKVGLFLAGGLAVLLVGGLFTTAVCSLTPICTITFNGFNGISNETMRSFMSPDRISAAAELVQDAVGKYQRLQRAVNG